MEQPCLIMLLIACFSPLHGAALLNFDPVRVGLFFIACKHNIVIRACAEARNLARAEHLFSVTLKAGGEADG